MLFYQRFLLPGALPVHADAATGERALLTKQKLQRELSQFTAINGWHYHCLHQFVFTDEIKGLCDRTQCNRLLTAIASPVPHQTTIPLP